MYVGKKYTTSRTAEIDGTFTCKGCSYTSPARVMGLGEGTGNSPYFLDDVGAEVRAAEHAEANAHEDAELVLSIAVCPKCDQRDPEATRRFRVEDPARYARTAGIRRGTRRGARGADDRA